MTGCYPYLYPSDLVMGMYPYFYPSDLVLGIIDCNFLQLRREFTLQHAFLQITK